MTEKQRNGGDNMSAEDYVNAVLVLTEPCECGKDGHICDRCGGTGEVLTENGKALIQYIRTYLFD